MVIYNIQNFQSLFDALDRCPEGVSVVLRDGREYDWQTQRTFLRSLLASLDGARCSRLEVRAHGSAGTGILLGYLLSKDRGQVFTARSA